MSNLSESQRGEIIGLYKNNVPNSKFLMFIEPQYLVLLKSILMKKKLTSELRSGRPKSINKEGQRILKKIVNQKNRKSAEQIKNKFNEKKKTNNNVSTKTIRRTLHELNIFSHVP